MSWAGYDVMSSVYIALVPSVVFPVYFQDFLANGPNSMMKWGLLVAAAAILSGLSALAIAPLSRIFHRFNLLWGLTAGLIGSIAVMAVSQSLWLVSAAFVISQICYFSATAVYESFLPDVAPRGAVGRVSGFGWAMGYFGGIAGILLLLVLIPHQTADGAIFREIFTIIGLLSLVISLIVFSLMRFQRIGWSSTLSDGIPWARLRDVFRRGGRNRTVMLLLAGTTLMQAVIAVIGFFTVPMLARHFGQTIFDLLWLLLLIHVLSIPSTLAFAELMDRWSRRGSLMILTACWTIVLLLLAFSSSTAAVWTIGALIGCCIGATNSALRGFLAASIEVQESPAYFGLATCFTRIVSALGPMLFVAVAGIAGERAGFLAALLLLAVSAGLLNASLSQKKRSVQSVVG